MPLFAFLPNPGPGSDRPVSVWPYIAAAFMSSTSLLGAAVLAKLRWGVSVPVFVFGLANACTSSALAAYLFFTNHRRPLFPVERWWLTLGCFLAFWGYDGLLPAVLRFVHNTQTPLETLYDIVGTVVDFALVWGIVRILAFWGAKRYGAFATSAV